MTYTHTNGHGPMFVAAGVLSRAPHRFLCRLPICALPDDCEGCERFVCEQCLRVVSWDLGCGDAHFGKCDSCWYAGVFRELDPSWQGPLTAAIDERHR